MPFKDLLNRHGQMFQVLRNDTPVCDAKGLPNHETSTGRAYIGFLPQTDVVIGDWLKNTADELFLIIDIQTQFVYGKPHQKKAFCLTQAEFNRQQKNESSTIFNIQSVTGSIVGNNNIATVNYQTTIQDLKDKALVEAPNDEDLKKVITLLEMLVNEEVPAKQGLFSKFSHVFEKHSWLTGALVSTILNWLTTMQLP